MTSIITSDLRTGSTRLHRAVALISGHDHTNSSNWFIPGSDTSRLFSPFSPNHTYKTHKLFPDQYDQFREANPDVHIFVSCRPLYDTLVSQILYECRTRRIEGTNRLDLKKDEILSQLDTDLVNYVIKNRRESVRKLIAHYARHYTQEPWPPTVVQVDFDVFNADPISVIYQLAKVLGVSPSPDHAVEIADAISFPTLSAELNPHSDLSKGFIRRGVTGDWRNYLNNESLAIINHELNQL
jgi:hypothetical protein